MLVMLVMLTRVRRVEFISAEAGLAGARPGLIVMIINGDTQLT